MRQPVEVRSAPFCPPDSPDTSAYSLIPVSPPCSPVSCSRRSIGCFKTINHIELPTHVVICTCGYLDPVRSAATNSFPLSPPSLEQRPLVGSVDSYHHRGKDRVFNRIVMNRYWCNVVTPSLSLVILRQCWLFTLSLLSRPLKIPTPNHILGSCRSFSQVSLLPLLPR